MNFTVACTLDREPDAVVEMIGGRRRRMDVVLLEADLGEMTPLVMILWFYLA